MTRRKPDDILDERLDVAQAAVERLLSHVRGLRDRQIGQAGHGDRVRFAAKAEDIRDRLDSLRLDVYR